MLDGDNTEHAVKRQLAAAQEAQNVQEDGENDWETEEESDEVPASRPARAPAQEPLLIMMPTGSSSRGEAFGARRTEPTTREESAARAEPRR